MHPIFFSMVIELSRQPFDRNSNRQVECPEARISKPETCTPCHLPNSQKSPPQDSSAHKNKHKKVRIWAEDMVSSLYALTQIQSKCRNTPVGHPARGWSGRPSQYMQPSDPAVDSRASLITMLLCRTESPQGLPDLIFLFILFLSLIRGFLIDLTLGLRKCPQCGVSLVGGYLVSLVREIMGDA